METLTLKLDDDGHWLAQAGAILRAGGLVGVPTETVYGLAGDATSDAGVAAIYLAKGRPAHNPLIVHVADLAMAARLAVFDARALMLAEAFWPGPLTMVLPLYTGHGLSSAVTAGGQSVAIRCPQGPLRALSAELDRALAAPSANRSGHVSPTSAQHVRDDLGGRIPLVLDDGPCVLGLESTILDLRAAPLLLRPGALDAASIESVLGEPVLLADKSQSAPVSPGLLASHYAPRVPVRLDVLPDGVLPGEAYLGFGQHHLDSHHTLSASGDIGEAAGCLYTMLRALDGPLVRAIAIAPIPQEGLGLALANRLQRAAAART